MSAIKVLVKQEMGVLFNLIEVKVEKQVFGFEVSELQNEICLGFD